MFVDRRKRCSFFCSILPFLWTTNIHNRLIAVGKKGKQILSFVKMFYVRFEEEMRVRQLVGYCTACNLFFTFLSLANNNIISSIKIKVDKNNICVIVNILLYVFWHRPKRTNKLNHFFHNIFLTHRYVLL
jgi:hypothetical protein